MPDDGRREQRYDYRRSHRHDREGQPGCPYGACPEKRGRYWLGRADARAASPLPSSPLRAGNHKLQTPNPKPRALARVSQLADSSLGRLGVDCRMAAEAVLEMVEQVFPGDAVPLAHTIQDVAQGPLGQCLVRRDGYAMVAGCGGLLELDVTSPLPDNLVPESSQQRDDAVTVGLRQPGWHRGLRFRSGSAG